MGQISLFYFGVQTGFFIKKVIEKELERFTCIECISETGVCDRGRSGIPLCLYAVVLVANAKRPGELAHVPYKYLHINTGI